MTTTAERKSSAEVDVWVWPLAAGPAQLAEYEALLSQAEAGRLSRRRSTKGRMEYLVAHGRMREILALYTSSPPQGLTYKVGLNGKPALPGDGPFFNLSHAGAHAALAVCASHEVGIDIEAPRTIEPGVARRFFSPSEVAALDEMPEEAWQHGFFRVWTGKEAVIKATGDGLALELASFDVLPALEQCCVTVTSTLPPRTPVQLSCHRFAATSDIPGCVAVRDAGEIKLTMR